MEVESARSGAGNDGNSHTPLVLYVNLFWNSKTYHCGLIVNGKNHDIMPC
jgi:hypothetical protein